MTGMPTKNLTTLFELAVRDDESAETELFSYLSARFRLFVKRRLWGQDDWEDVVQEALTTIYLKYKEVEPADRFAGWAYQVLKNKIMNYTRTKSHRGRVVTRLPYDGDSIAIDDTEQSLKRQLLKCLKQIWRVNVRYARILNLHHLGYSTEEICHKLGLQPGTYYNVLSRARKKLKQCLESGGLHG